MEAPDQQRAQVANSANEQASHHVEVRQLAPVAGGSAAITVWLAMLGLITTPVMLRTLGSPAYLSSR